MITVPVSYAVLAFLVVTVAFVIVVWLFSGRRRTELFTKETGDHVWRCPICSHVYLVTRLDGFAKCPQCGSMNTEAESEKVDLKGRRRKRGEDGA